MVRELARKKLISDHNSCRQIMVIERTSRGNVVATGGGNTVCFWSARTLALLHSYTFNISGQTISSLSLSLSEEVLSIGCDDGQIFAVCLPNFRDASDPHAPNQKHTEFKLKARHKGMSVADPVGSGLDNVAEKAKTVVKNAFRSLSKCFHLQEIGNCNTNR